MIKKLLISGAWALLLIFTVARAGQAQTDRIAKFLWAGIDNAEILTKAYLKPIPGGVGAGLNSGWFTTAGTHQPLGFDIQIRGVAAFIPSSHQHFDISKLSLKNIRPANASHTISPTVGGADAKGPEVIVRHEGKEVGRFNLPGGTGYHFVPAPMIQATLGTIKDTDLIVRFVPKVEIANYGDFQLKGVGIKHQINQWLPGGKFFPVDISIMAGYSRMDLTSDLNLQPPEGAIPDPNYRGNYENQKITATFDTFTARFIVGKEFPFLSVYGAVGYQTSKMNFAVKGDYPIPVAGPAGIARVKTVTDPFSYQTNTGDHFSLTGGLNLKLFFFHIFGEYTLAKYSTVNAGIGFSFR